MRTYRALLLHAQHNCESVTTYLPATLLDAVNGNPKHAMSKSANAKNANNKVLGERKEV